MKRTIANLSQPLPVQWWQSNASEPEPGEDPKPTEPEVKPEAGGYVPPATQADLDKILGERLARERAKFADYDDLKAKAAERDKLIEASKTEAEKQAEELAKLKTENEAFRAEKQVAEWAREVAADKQVDVSLLRGSTREELEAHADQLAAFMATSATAGNGRTPVPTAGQQPGRTNVPIAQQIAAAEADGKHELARTLKAMQLGSLNT